MAGAITDIKVQDRNGRWVQVYVEGEPAFTLPVEEAVHLRRGQQLNAADMARWRALSQYYQAKERALAYLARRPRSMTEVRRYLKDKGFDTETIERVMTRLQTLDYVNDRTFAAYWVEQRTTFRPRGVIALRHELRQKGVDEHIIDEVVAQVDETVGARQALRPHLHRWRALDWPTFRQKATAFLARRGFHYETIREVVQEAWQEIHQAPPEDPWWEE